MSYTSTNQGYYSGGYDGFDDDEKSLLPRSLAWAVLVLGFASYLFRFGPLPTGHDASWGVRFAVLAALAAGFGLIPRQSTSHQVVAALAVAGFLDALAVRIGGSGGWALTVIAVLTGLQSVAAIGGLLQAHPADEQDQPEPLAVPPVNPVGSVSVTVIAPLVGVLASVAAEGSGRRPRRGGPVPPPSHGWHWRLSLGCGHRARRPYRQKKAGGSCVNCGPPKRVRCDACGAAQRAEARGA